MWVKRGMGMRKLIEMTKRFRDEEGGAALIEYTVLLGIMVATVITLIIGVGTWNNGEWSAFSTALGIAP